MLPRRNSLNTAPRRLLCPYTWIDEQMDILEPYRPWYRAYVEAQPALTRTPSPGDLERTLIALPARLGGLGIHIPSRAAANEYHASQQVTSTLCDHVISQDLDYSSEIIAKQLEVKAQISRETKERTSSEFNEVYENLPVSLRRAVNLATEKGSSTWLTALPLAEHGFTLHKGNALALRYGWAPSEICACGNNLSVEHALSCAKGGFPSIRHNKIRDLTATLRTEVCHDVCIEPGLQPISNEILTGATTNTQDGARLDVAANGFWGGTYSLTSECSIPMPRQTVAFHSHPVTGSKSR